MSIKDETSNFLYNDDFFALFNGYTSMSNYEEYCFIFVNGRLLNEKLILLTSILCKSDFHRWKFFYLFKYLWTLNDVLSYRCWFLGMHHSSFILCWNSWIFAIFSQHSLKFSQNSLNILPDSLNTFSDSLNILPGSLNNSQVLSIISRRFSNCNSQKCLKFSIL